MTLAAKRYVTFYLPHAASRHYSSSPFESRAAAYKNDNTICRANYQIDFRA